MFYMHDFSAPYQMTWFRWDSLLLILGPVSAEYKLIMLLCNYLMFFLIRKSQEQNNLVRKNSKTSLNLQTYPCE